MTYSVSDSPGGATASLGGINLPVVLAVPWLELLLVLGCAVLAGVLVSVLPTRRATTARPVAALVEK